MDLTLSLRLWEGCGKNFGLGQGDGGVWVQASSGVGKVVWAMVKRENDLRLNEDIFSTILQLEIPPHFEYAVKLNLRSKPVNSEEYPP